MPARAISAVLVSVTGVVQGVGFRPFVHRLAARYGLKGWVRNEAGEVRIVVEGPRVQVEAFLGEIQTDPPPLARIDGLVTTWAEPEGLSGFRIVESLESADGRQPVSPDVALCAACQRELMDPSDRRFGYPFITCTDCGPRFTVIEAMPYDRRRTSMRRFMQCDSCLAEYGTPSHRRYHSETNSCPVCGPRIWLERPADPPERVTGSGGAVSDDVVARGTDSGGCDPVAANEAALRGAAEALLAGEIVAIKGLGGFHLAVDATNDQAVARLRRRKAREAKPLALMVRGLPEAKNLGVVGPAEEEFLTSPERPVVLLRPLPETRVSPLVAPGLDTVGVMTAYTPLHHLLLESVGRPLVMTSGNLTDEPIAIGNDDARRRLGRIADRLLLHDREIVARYDDSVVKITRKGPIFLRRARGFAPLPLSLPVAAPRPLLAVGPHLKNTFTLVHRRDAYVSQHIGDLENMETLEHFRDSLAMYRRLFRIHPEAVARDLHPGYLSTRLAAELGLAETIPVQHHHAHIAAVCAEHGVMDPVIGIAFDGTGYGDDGAVWGAELMVADLRCYERVGHLRYAPLPGGDLAARQPWRAALGYCSLEAEGDRALRGPFREAFAPIPEAELQIAQLQIRRGLNAPLASSMGRLFDAAAAVLGVRHRSQYEGQAAMELESLAGNRSGQELKLPVGLDTEGRWTLDPLPLLNALGELRSSGTEMADLAAGFHDAVAGAAVEIALRVAEERSLSVVALGGGSFQNGRLLDRTASGLGEAGLRVLVPRKLSPNDGAISYGQAAVAAAVLLARAS